jgi:hypothetical protein
MRFHVHLFPPIRIKVSNVEAETYEQAIERAEDVMYRNIYDAFQGWSTEDDDTPDKITAIEWSEDVADSALVDVDGDIDYARSKLFDRNYDKSKPEWLPAQP